MSLTNTLIDQEKILVGGESTTLHKHDHNNLDGRQGGTTDDYQHLTTAQVAKVDFVSITQAVDLDATETKVDTIEEGATADQTATEIETLYEGITDTNKFQDAEKTKVGYIAVTQTVDLDTIESNQDSHIANTSNPHSVTQTQVGLSNVDNTSDANKPVSTAQQTAFDLKLDKTGGTISSDLIVSGNFTVNGTTTTVNSTEVTTADNIIVLNDGETGAGVTVGSSGIEVDRGTETNYEFKFDETDDSFKIGEIGSLQKVATREDAPTDAGVAIWDNATSKFNTAVDVTVNSLSVATTVDGRDVSVDGAKLDNIEVSVNDLDNAVGTTALVKRHDKILGSLDIIATTYDASDNLDLIRYTGDDDSTIYYRDVLVYTSSVLTSVKHFNGTDNIVTPSATTTLTHTSGNLSTTAYVEA